MQRSTSLWVASLLSAATIGFCAGTREDWPEPVGYQPPPASSAVQGPPARSYTELRQAGIKPNEQIYLASRMTLVGLLPSLTDQVAPREPGRAEALAARQRRRAYDGAPPTIPHRADPRLEPNCLVCHERGAKIADRIAPKLSHPVFSGCPQCHVEALSPEALSPGHVEVPAPEALAPPDRAAAGAATAAAAAGPGGVANAFTPEPFGGLGARAWPKAPPVVPHRVFMRQACDSCHGVTGAFGLRTPHPDRQSCLQCHVPDHERDPSSFFAAVLAAPGAP